MPKKIATFPLTPRQGGERNSEQIPSPDNSCTEEEWRHEE